MTHEITVTIKMTAHDAPSPARVRQLVEARFRDACTGEWITDDCHVFPHELKVDVKEAKP